MKQLLFLCLGLSLFASLALAAPRVSLRYFMGDISKQDFHWIGGELVQQRVEGDTTFWTVALEGEADFSVEALSVSEGPLTRWSFTFSNAEPDTTISEIACGLLEDVKPGGSWEGARLLWPSLYQGALITALGDQTAFEEECRIACKGVPYPTGLYQGDLCLPFFCQLGGGHTVGMRIADPTHELVRLSGQRSEEGLDYSFSVCPKLRTGQSWSFGEVEVFDYPFEDWHLVADRHREWLEREGFRPATPRDGDVATFSYGRWDPAKPAEVIAWAAALGAQDVCLWLDLYGRGDQYYPCYFPRPDDGIKGMTAKLDELRAAGLHPYFYTNGYLLSPLQTHEDALEWRAEFPDQYPEHVAQGDVGYAQTVAEFRKGYDFAGDWLAEPEAILPLRVRRADFYWGEHPMYFWHGRPFWAACVASPEWRKLFKDTARLHGEMGAGGIFIDQVSAIAPEFCSAAGHGHDEDTFGFWNRAYLDLLAEVKATGEALQPGFFIEVEGATDLYAKYVDRFLTHFGAAGPLEYPRLFRYTVPWSRTDCGQYPLDDGAAVRANIEQTLLLGCTFRVSGGKTSGDWSPDDPVFTSEGMRLMKAAVAARRLLVPYIDEGSFLDDVGLSSEGCEEATWFSGSQGLLLVAKVTSGEGRLRGQRPTATCCQARPLIWIGRLASGIQSFAPSPKGSWR